MNKIFITAQELLSDSFRLANQIFLDGFKPDCIVGVWRGGAPIAIAVQEYFEYKNIKTDHMPIRTSSYYDIDKQADEINIYGLQYLVNHIQSSDNLLLVDDVFDSGRSIAQLIKLIKAKSKHKHEQNIKTACVWYKPGKAKVGFAPDYFIHKNDNWLVFPHELQGLSHKEIANNKSDFDNILNLF